MDSWIVIDENFTIGTVYFYATLGHSSVNCVQSLGTFSSLITVFIDDVDWLCMGWEGGKRIEVNGMNWNVIFLFAFECQVPSALPNWV